MRVLVRYLFLFTFATLTGISLCAQTTATGSILGTVTDPTHAVIVGAQLTATQTTTGITRTTITGASGTFALEGLTPGHYAVKVTKTGFNSGSSKTELLVGQALTINYVLKPGSVDETVEVSADSVLLDVTKTSVSQEITPSQVEDMPLIGRDAANLAYLAPGVKMADSFDPTKNRSAVLSVNGNIGREVNVTINGVDNKDNSVGGTVMQLPLEGVQEFIISTQRFSAANGRSEGAAINMITKQGGNQIHGSAFSYFREQQFNANQASPDGTKSNPPYSRQFFGGSVGAPILRDKFFGFFAYERQREKTSISESGKAYTELAALQKAGLFGTVASSTVPTPFYENRYNGRLDYKINNKHTAYLSISQQSNNSINDQEDSLGDLSVGNYTQNHMNIANLTLNSAFSNTLLNTLTFGAQYWNNLITTDNNAAPLITFASSEWVGQSANVSQQSFQRKWQFKDDITKTINKHTLNFGVDYIWEPGLGGYFKANSTLEIDYGKQDPTTILAMPLGFSTPGLVTGMSLSNGDPATNVPGGTKQIGLYFQDDWKATKRLTVNLGLRWDKDVNLIGGSALVNSRTFMELKGMGSSYGVTPHDDNKDFSPRVGFSYDLTGVGKHVLRGGFGLYYGNVFQNIPLWMEQQANKTVYQGALSISNAKETVPGLNIPLSDFAYSVANVATVTAGVSAATGNLSSGATGRTMDPHYRNPYSEEFNIGYQWALAPNWVFEAEYTHTLGLHSNVDVNINYIDPTSGNRVMSSAFTTYANANCGGTDYCVLGRTMNNEAIGRTRYDGMNLSLRHQLDRHFSLTANYTLSRAVGYAINSGGNPSNGSSYHNYPHDPRHPLASWDFGPTPYDELHHITVSGIAKLPFGLEASPILQFGTGRPYDMNSGVDVLGLGSGYSRPVIVPNSDPTNYTYYASYFEDDANSDDPGLTARACLDAGNCHIVSYNKLRGQDYFELDARLSKNLKFRGKNLQLNFQGFNLTNRANYGNNFTETITSSNFGKASGFMNPTSSSTAKAFVGEFGARFTF
jgi:outer membrane receptor protein involved in Fe transport